jgi:hypothetical protein
MIICDKCGRKILGQQNSLSPTDFKITVTDDGGPGGSERSAEYSGTVSHGVTMQPCWGIYFCDECVFDAFYKGVQDEWIRRHPGTVIQEGTTPNPHHNWADNVVLAVKAEFDDIERRAKMDAYTTSQTTQQTARDIRERIMAALQKVL